MNKNLENYARKYILEKVTGLKSPQIDLFRRIYSHKKISKPLTEIVSEIGTSHLEEVMYLIDRTILKNEKVPHGTSL